MGSIVGGTSDDENPEAIDFAGRLTVPHWNGRANELGPLSAKDILDLLEGDPVDSWRHRMLLREFPVEGYGRGYGSPRIDGLGVNFRDGEVIAYEVKISRSDFKNELGNPEKRARAHQISNFFYFVTPEGLVGAQEIPEDCGLIYVSRDWQSPRIIKAAPPNRQRPPDWRRVGDLMTAAFRLGQEDASRREPLHQWWPVYSMAETLATACGNPPEVLLASFEERLRQSGRRHEANEIFDLLMQFWSEKEKPEGPEKLP